MSTLFKYQYQSEWLLSGFSLRKNAIECGVSLNTSFIWRHKLLRCFDNVSAGEYKGILEIDELFFPVSEKGSRKLVNPKGTMRSRSKKRGINNDKVAVIELSKLVFSGRKNKE